MPGPNPFEDAPTPSSLWTEGTSAQRYQRGAAYLRGTRPSRSRPARGQTASRRGYQKQRVESFREHKSNITVDSLAKELREKLMPGIRNVEEAIKSKECASIEKAIPTPIKTRQLGFGTCKLFSNISTDPRIQNSVNDGRCTPYQWYPVLLTPSLRRS